MKKILVIAAAALFLFGCSEETIDIEGQATTYEELKDKIGEKEEDLAAVEKDLEKVEKEVESVEGELKGVEDKLTEKEDEYSKLKELSKNEKDLKSNVKDKESTLEKLKGEIEESQETLEELEGKIVKAVDDPVEIGAGEYTFGFDADILPGRYEVFPLDRGSNFSVYDDTGSLQVSTILGEGGSSVPSYVFHAGQEYIVKSRAPVKLVPVE